MAEGGSGGTKVGELYYDVTMDTSKMIEGEKKAEKSTDDLKTAMTEVAVAVRALTTVMAAVAAASRDMATATSVAAVSDAQLTAAAARLANAEAERKAAQDAATEATKGLVAATKAAAAADAAAAASSAQLAEAAKKTAAEEAQLAAAQAAAAKAAKDQETATKAAAVAAAQAAKAQADAAAANAKAAEAAGKGAVANDKQAMSAKAMSAAMRNVPAQFTDIVTSLQGGQRPLSVLLQQGGQLKDMFGGIGPAVRALGTYVVGLINPFTLAAVAIAAFVFPFIKGRQEMENFNRSLELTGGQAGVTADQLGMMAKSMDSMADVTRGKAAEALNVFVQAGIGGEQNLDKFTRAAIRLEQAGGPAIEDTAKAFKDLEKAPVQSAIKLNDSVNFLTDSIYKQIRTLQEQGRTVDAAKVAQNAYADAINIRAPAILEKMGLLERGWKSIAGAAKEGWDAMLNVGRPDTLEEQLEKARKALKGMERTGPRGARIPDSEPVARGRTQGDLRNSQRAAIADMEARIKGEQNIADAKAKQLEKVNATKKFDDAGDTFLSNSELMKREIDQAKAVGLAAEKSEEDIQKRISDIRKKFGVEGKSLAAQEYYQGLVADNKTAVEKIDAEEQKALLDNDKRMAQDRDNAGVYAKAKVEINKKYDKERALFAEQAQQQVGDLNIELTTEEVSKVEAIRAEAIRRAGAAERLGVVTTEQAARQRVAANFEAEQSIKEIRERQTQALADALIDITKSQEQKITLTRQESIRQAQELYQRGKITFEEMEAAKTKALFDETEKRKALEVSRDATKIGTLQVKAGAGGTQDQEDLMRAQAEAQIKAVEEARQHDIEASQLYADQKVAIEADMNRRIAEMRASANSAALSSTSDAFGALAGVLKNSQGEQSGIYKAMFAASKAFAIADAIVKIQQGIAGAAALPWPANLAAIGSVVAATASIVGTIQGANYGGGRQYGGAVGAGNMYRVNETGRPEMFTAANGSQYMLPTASGSVTPADQVGGSGGGPAWQIIVNNNASNTQASASVDRDQRIVTIAVNEVANQFATNSGPVWSAATRASNIKARV